MTESITTMRFSVVLLGVLVVVASLLVQEGEGAPSRGSAAKRKGKKGENRSIRRNVGRFGQKRGRKGRQEEEYEENTVDEEGEEAEASGSDIANGCDHLTEIGAFMNHAKELAWCLENDPELELGLYAPLVALAEARAADALGSGSGEVEEEVEAAMEVVRAAKRARARRGRKGRNGGKAGRRNKSRARKIKTKARAGRRSQAGPKKG